MFLFFARQFTIISTALKKLFLVLFLVFASKTVLFAQEVDKKKSPLRFLIAGALEFGGDPVAEVYFTDGNTQSVKAGQGASLALGAQLQFPAVEKLILRATVGYKYVTTEADNAHIRLTRIPISLTANWMIVKNLRLGAGLTNHQNIQFKADGIGRDIDLKSSSGPTFELAYHGIGLTYTALDYKDQESRNYSANAIGVSFSTTIGRR